MRHRRFVFFQSGFMAYHMLSASPHIHLQLELLASFQAHNTPLIGLFFVLFLPYLLLSKLLLLGTLPPNPFLKRSIACISSTCLPLLFLLHHCLSFDVLLSSILPFIKLQFFLPSIKCLLYLQCFFLLLLFGFHFSFHGYLRIDPFRDQSISICLNRHFHPFFVHLICLNAFIFLLFQDFFMVPFVCLPSLFKSLFSTSQPIIVTLYT